MAYNIEQVGEIMRPSDEGTNLPDVKPQIWNILKYKTYMLWYPILLQRESLFVSAASLHSK